MSGVKKTCNTWNSAAVLPFVFGVIWSSSLAAETPMTAGVVVRNMSSERFVAYVTGMIEGLAYARFRRDSEAAGGNAEEGMTCMRSWYLDDPDVFLTIDATFRDFADYPPAVVIAAMLEKECGA